MYLLLSMTLILSGCQTNRILEIGFIGTMTGPGSDLSVSGRRGAELAIQEVNSSGGINGA